MQAVACPVCILHSLSHLLYCNCPQCLPYVFVVTVVAFSSSRGIEKPMSPGEHRDSVMSDVRFVFRADPSPRELVTLQAEDGF